MEGKGRGFSSIYTRTIKQLERKLKIEMSEEDIEESDAYESFTMSLFDRLVYKNYNRYTSSCKLINFLKTIKLKIENPKPLYNHLEIDFLYKKI
jgi:hypothetical protein